MRRVSRRASTSRTCPAAFPKRSPRTATRLAAGQFRLAGWPARLRARRAQTGGSGADARATERAAATDRRPARRGGARAVVRGREVALCQRRWPSSTVTLLDPFRERGGCGRRLSHPILPSSSEPILGDAGRIIVGSGLRPLDLEPLFSRRREVTLAAGSRLGPYEILAPLGAGGMGEVYRARDTRLGREVAIKVLPAEVASDASRLKRFEKEARSASALNHPNIVTIYDIGSDGRVSYIAMERVEGKTLRELLFGGALPVKKLLPIAAQIADGLARAHEAGIVHRDLKPENVMVTKDGLVKILDFGLAKLTHGWDRAATRARTCRRRPGRRRAWSSGRSATCRRSRRAGQPVDFRSDQFSFGSILYEMATGKRAFQKGTGGGHALGDPARGAGADRRRSIRRRRRRCAGSSSDASPRTPRGATPRRGTSRASCATVRDLISEAVALGRRVRGRRPGAPSRWLSGSRGGSRRRAGVVGARLLGGSEALAESRDPAADVSRRETILTARFAPDGQTIVYSVASEPGCRRGRALLDARRQPGVAFARTSPRRTCSRFRARGELAVLLGDDLSERRDTRYALPLAGGAPREILENVSASRLGAGWQGAGRRPRAWRARSGSSFRSGRCPLRSPTRCRDVGGVAEGRSDRLQPTDGRADRFSTSPGKKQKRSDRFKDFAWSPRGDEILFNELRRGSDRDPGRRPRRPKAVSRRRCPGDFVLQDVSREGGVSSGASRSTKVEMIGRSPGDSDGARICRGWTARFPRISRPTGRRCSSTRRSRGRHGGRRLYAPNRRLGRRPARRRRRRWRCRRTASGRSPPVTSGGSLSCRRGAGQPRTLPFAGLRRRCRRRLLPGQSAHPASRPPRPGTEGACLSYDIDERPGPSVDAGGLSRCTETPRIAGRTVRRRLVEPEGKCEICITRRGASRPLAGFVGGAVSAQDGARIDAPSSSARRPDNPVKVYRLDLSRGGRESLEGVLARPDRAPRP